MPNENKIDVEVLVIKIKLQKIHANAGNNEEKLVYNKFQTKKSRR